MYRADQNSRHRPILGLLLLVVSVAACGAATAATGAPSTPGHGPTAPKQLVAPKTSAAQETRYLADVGKADTSLDTYIQTDGDLALRAIVTDGSAFCAFLNQGGGIDAALTSVAVGARSVESQTHLPLSVTTFNTIEASALIALCPGEQRLIPSQDRAKLRRLASLLDGNPRS